MTVDVTGRCLCGGVVYEAKDVNDAVTVCHCSQCRKSTGHQYATANLAYENLHLITSDTLSWYAASDSAKRGFCRTCGSSLFWLPNSHDHISILAGTVDDSTGMHIAKHIFVDDKAAYYEILEDVPRYGQDSAAG